MRALVQRVSGARVSVDGRVSGEIGAGLLVLIGATHSDGESESAWLAETAGACLVVPQFTLYGDARRGRRPDFTAAARPEQAEPLFEHFCTLLAEQGVRVERGVFRAHMSVELVNDGPVTLRVQSPGVEPGPEPESRA